MEGEISNIKSDFMNDNNESISSKDVVDLEKYKEKKMNEKNENPAKLKKPDGRDKSQDIEEEIEQEYKQENYYNRDKKGL